LNLQTLVMMAGSGLLLVSSVTLVRRRLLSVRYGLGWITVSLVGIAGAPVLQVLAPDLSRILGFTPTGFSLGTIIGFLALICLQLSISLSGVHRVVQDLSEHAAMTERRLRALEADGAPSSSVVDIRLGTGDSAPRTTRIS
jgi:hypothetical protein